MATLWPRDQTAVFTVEEPTVSKTKEGSLGQESNQKHSWGIYLQGCTKLVPTGRAFKSNSTSSIVIRYMRVNLVKRSELWRNGNWTLQYGNVRLSCLQQQLSLLISLQRLSVSQDEVCSCWPKFQVHGEITYLHVTVVTKTYDTQVLM